MRPGWWEGQSVGLVRPRRGLGQFSGKRSLFVPQLQQGGKKKRSGGATVRRGGRVQLSGNGDVEGCGDGVAASAWLVAEFDQPFWDA